RLEMARRLLAALHQTTRLKEIPIESNVSAFVRALEGHEPVSAWSENPLLLSLAVVVFMRTGTLPYSRIIFSQEIIDTVLAMREPDVVQRETLLRVLAHLALELYQMSLRTFSLDDLLNLLPRIREKQHENWLTEEM